MTTSFRRRIAAFAAFFVALTSFGYAFIQSAPPAQAASGTVFDIKDADTAGANDWDGNAAKYHITTTTDLCGNGQNGDDRIVQSTKLDADPWPTDTGNVNTKTDLCQVWTGYEEVSPSKTVLLFAWLRDGNTGTANVYVPLADTELAGRAGDILLKFAYDSANPPGIVVTQLSWTGSAWGNEKSLDAYSDYSVSTDTRFAEVALDLQAAGVLPVNGDCKALVSGDVITETGQDTGNPTLMDLVKTPDIEFNTCASITVGKVTQPAGLSGPFSFDLQKVGGGYSQTDVQLASDGSSVTFDDVPAGNYTLVEDDPSAVGFDLFQIVCDNVDITSGGTFTVQANGTYTCSIVNRAKPGTLTLVKSMDIQNGGTKTADDFTPYVDGQTTIQGQTVAWSTPLTLTVGSYTASESTIPGYVAGAWGGDCAADGSVDIGPAEDKTCTITNSDTELTVDLDKSVDVSSLPEPGGAFTYTLTVTNTSAVEVTITDLTDTNSGDAVDFSACTALIGDTLAPSGSAGDSTSCTYVVNHNDAGTYPNTADVEVSDAESRTATDQDSETVTVTDTPPTVDLLKEGSPGTLPEPGGDFTFTLTITNTSSERVEITTLSDTQGSDSPNFVANCGPLVGTFLDPGDSTSCSYTVTHTDAGSYDNTAEVTVQDNEGSTASDTDDETVTVSDEGVGVELTKTANPTELDEPGGDFTFQLTIQNLSVEEVTITQLTDTNSGDAVDFSDCSALIGTTLAPAGESGSSTFCTYVVSHTEAGSYPNTADVTVADNENNTASDTDDETVVVNDLPPTVTLVKSVDQSSLPEPGGDFTYTLTITNTSVEDVTITALTDTNSGDAADFSDCTALIGDSLAPGESVDCTYTVTWTEAGTYPNTATVTVEDNEGNSASDEDVESVEVTDVPPTVTIDKTASPSTLVEPGGDFEFTLTITNTSTIEAVEITELTDTQSAAANDFSDCTDLIGTMLDPGESVTCTYTVTHTQPGEYDNEASVTVEDNEGTPATDVDDATVTVTAVQWIKVVKVFDVDANGVRDELPAGAQPPAFTFEATWGDFALEIDEEYTAPNLTVGTEYSVAENPTTIRVGNFDWKLVSASCSSDLRSSIDPSSIVLSEGEKVTCTFFNTRIAVAQVTTTTTAPTTTTSVSPSTLPFTGAGDASLVGFGVAFSVLGLLLLAGARRREEETG